LRRGAVFHASGVLFFVRADALLESIRQLPYLTIHVATAEATAQAQGTEGPMYDTAQTRADERASISDSPFLAADANTLSTVSWTQLDMMRTMDEVVLQVRNDPVPPDSPQIPVSCFSLRYCETWFYTGQTNAKSRSGGEIAPRKQTPALTSPMNVFLALIIPLYICLCWRYSRRPSSRFRDSADCPERERVEGLPLHTQHIGAFAFTRRAWVEGYTMRFGAGRRTRRTKQEGLLSEQTRDLTLYSPSESFPNCFRPPAVLPKLV